MRRWIGPDPWVYDTWLGQSDDRTKRTPFLLGWDKRRSEKWKAEVGDKPVPPVDNVEVELVWGDDGRLDVITRPVETDDDAGECG